MIQIIGIKYILFLFKCMITKTAFNILVPEKHIATLKTKLFDYDSIESRWYKAPIYKYTLVKETSNITVTGHGDEWSNGKAVIYEISDDGWAIDTIYCTLGDENQAMKSPFSSNGFKDIIDEKGVIEIKKEKVGISEWDITVDTAKGLIVDVTREDMINY